VSLIQDAQSCAERDRIVARHRIDMEEEKIEEAKMGSLVVEAEGAQQMDRVLRASMADAIAVLDPSMLVYRVVTGL
jgi:hypothetical protein